MLPYVDLLYFHICHCSPHTNWCRASGGNHSIMPLEETPYFMHLAYHLLHQRESVRTVCRCYLPSKKDKWFSVSYNQLAN